MVHNSKALVGTFKRLIEAACGLPLGQRPWEVSDPKRSGEVFVRFWSSDRVDALTLAERFRDVLNAQGYEFTQVEDTKFRFPLGQF